MTIFTFFAMAIFTLFLAYFVENVKDGKFEYNITYIFYAEHGKLLNNFLVDFPYFF